MSLSKKRILSFLAILCILSAFLLRRRNEQQLLLQICPALSSPSGFSVTLESGETVYDVHIDDGPIFYSLKDAPLKRGKKTNSSPVHHFRIVVHHESEDWLLTIGADHTLTAARLGNLEKTRTFWLDPTGTLFDTLYTHHLACGGAPIPGYISQTERQSIHFAKHDFSAVNSIRLKNLHNGHTTYLTPGQIPQVTAFVSSLTGINATTSRGYYEGTYSLTFIEDKEEIFSLSFGDTPTFLYGDYGDGYPARYQLDNITIEEVTAFLAQFDSSIP